MRELPEGPIPEFSWTIKLRELPTWKLLRNCRFIIGDGYLFRRNLLSNQRVKLLELSTWIVPGYFFPVELRELLGGYSNGRSWCHRLL